MSISSRLRKYRQQRGLTLRAVADAICVPVSTYRDWEYGKAIRWEPYEKLADLFGIDLGELTNGGKAKNSDVLALLEDASEKIKKAIQIAKAL